MVNSSEAKNPDIPGKKNRVVPVGVKCSIRVKMVSLVMVRGMS